MFGYIKPNIPELRVKDHELYKATYCGLCRTMGKCTGCASKFTLSYDFAFFALVRMALEKTQGQVKMRRCMVHPFKKRPIMEINPVLEYSAKSSVILTRLKLKDNVNDSRGISRLKAKIVGLVSLFFKKTDKSLLPLEEKIKECIDNLTTLEKEECDSIDKVADTFGQLLGNVASFGLEKEKAILGYEIGYHLGKWIYVIDACDDLTRDVKSGSYNVLKIAFGNSLDNSQKYLVRSAMFLELNKMAKATELIDFTEHRDVEAIIKNIIFDGLIEETNRVLDIKEETNEKN
ncbi:MAG: hypothetical protein J6D23_03535 [Clostridia bacterium]|nr:hypothetical protein [Clostridia bacterium]